MGLEPKEFECEDCGAMVDATVMDVPYYCPNEECKGKFTLRVND